MNRLTERLPNGVVRAPVTDENRGDSCMMRLAAYEDLSTVRRTRGAERADAVGACEREIAGGSFIISGCLPRME